MAETEAASKPLYLRMKEDLLRRVQSGEWRPGELIPGESALAAEYRVSVGTARKAIEDLAGQRLLIRQRGRGTTVALHAHREEVLRHYRLHTKDGHPLNQKTLYLDIASTRASAAEAKSLGISRGAAVTRVRRLRFHNKQPIVIEHLSLREDLLPGIAALIEEKRPEILYGVLQREFHILIEKVREKVTAVRAEAEDSELLGIAPDEPMLQIERIALDLKGRAIDRRIMRARNDTFYLSEFA